jgi:hypothetical protein
VDEEGHAARVDFDATAYPPTSLEIRVRDLVELPGRGWFEVVSIVDYDNNSIGWKPGVADTKLRRVTG